MALLSRGFGTNCFEKVRGLCFCKKLCKFALHATLGSMQSCMPLWAEGKVGFARQL